MGHRVVHIGDGGFLSLHQGAMRIQRQGNELALIPLADLACVVLDGYEIALTAQIAARLSEENVALVFSDTKHLPCGVVQPLSANSIHAETLRLQAECSVPKKKRIWQQIVIAKLEAPADLLQQLGSRDKSVRAMIPLVRSGDPDNIEARAAARYWSKLMGDEFTRNTESPGANAMLNYGYALIRSSVARCLSGTGLHPALGVFHRNRYNAFALADDAMEPLRPLVDAFVHTYLKSHEPPDDLTPPIKRHLAKVLVLPVIFAGNDYTFLGGCERYAASLRRGICEESRKLEIPRPKWSAVFESCG